MASSSRPTLRSITGRRRRRVGSSGPVAASVHPDAQPYAGGSGAAGVLLCHGFSGSTKSMIGWALHLEAAGFQVLLPRLPGHGTTWQELNRTAWTDWYASVEEAFATLRARCEQVFLAGLSMGGALCLRLAEQHGSGVSGLTLVNPVINISDPRMRALPVLRLLPSLGGIANDIAQPGQDEWGYDRLPLRALHSQTFLWADVRRNLHHVDQPLLVYRAIHDHVADPSSVRLIKAGVRSSDQTYIELQRSYHVATLDYDADDIFEGSVAFFRRLTKEADGSAE
ncbi:MAG TPA: alpha/beta fold hydrolase [Propionibacteriaceae bacterium]